MAEQRTGISLAEGLSCTLDATKEHPERYATILGGEKPLPLSKVQALALFRVMLSHLQQLVTGDLQNESLLAQVNLVQAFHSSIDWFSGWSQTELEDPDLLTQAHEQYQHTYALQEKMLEAVNGWQTTLEQEYSKLEDAAEELGMALDELGDEEDEGEESDEENEN
ncbi:MAG TPA: hypothetical protein VGN34_25720 [Ktedonobacteraceae bacterium]